MQISHIRVDFDESSALAGNRESGMRGKVEV